MATSRYDTPSQATSALTNPPKQGTATTQGGTSTTEGSTQSTGQTTGSSTTNQSGTSQTSTQNMTGSSLAALEALIAQLLGGGDQASANLRAQRLGEINTNQAARAGYSKEAAFGDAQGLIAQTMRQALEKTLPSITRASEGAGASQSSMRALLTQKATQEAAEAASAQGLNAAVQYGQVSNAFSNILERLTQPDNTNTANLLQALQTARGAVTNSTTNTSGTSTTDSTQQTQQQGTSQSQTNTNQSSATVPIKGGGSTYAGTGVDELVYFGPQQTGPTPTTGTTQDLLAQLGNDSRGGWSNGFTF